MDITNKIYKKIGINQHSVNELIKITKDDLKTWKIFEEGLTCEINQCSSQQGTKKVSYFKPKDIRDLCSFAAIIRPACASIEKKFLDREYYEFNIKEIDDILFYHTGIGSFLIFQESIMKILELAGIEKKDTYGIIKAISKKKKEVINSAKEKFFNGMSIILKDSKDKEKIINSLWQVINDASMYSLTK